MGVSTDSLLKRKHAMEVSTDSLLKREHAMEVSVDSLLKREHTMKLSTDSLLKRKHTMKLSAGHLQQSKHIIELSADYHFADKAVAAPLPCRGGVRGGVTIFPILLSSPSPFRKSVTSVSSAVGQQLTTICPAISPTLSFLIA